MLKYIFHRILLFLPSLLAISLLAFGLNNCSPGDEVQRLIPSYENLSPLKAKLAYERDYPRIAKQLGTSLPTFYFSVSARKYPDTLHLIFPKNERKVVRQLLAQYGNWPSIQTYRQGIDDCLNQALLVRENYQSNALIELTKSLEQLRIAEEPSQQNRLLKTIGRQLQEDSTLNATLHLAVQQLDQQHQTLLGLEAKWTERLPAFAWHGAENQYHHWLGRVSRGELGTSRNTGQQVDERIGKAIRWTLRINGWAIFFSYLLAIPLGVYTAYYAGGRFDRYTNLLLFLLYAIPSFWMATMLSKFLTLPEWLDLFPTMGVGVVGEDTSWWEALQIRRQHFFLPIFCVTYGSLAFVTRQVRNSMMGILQADYIRTARAKGLSERTVLWRHAFPNALFPLITLFANILPAAVAGAVIVEVIFNIPGIGKLTIDSIYSKDWPIVYALLLLTAVLTIIGILIADLLYAWADPRVKLDGRRQGN